VDGRAKPGNDMLRGGTKKSVLQLDETAKKFSATRFVYTGRRLSKPFSFSSTIAL
jgi:hypothetical protein